ncbi:ABC transporter permease [Actinomadura sp. DC4]|uniref:ABC transporter permease n=1 Tax=Actinomadura sp. DC4 TaxID=3055069 RepID=UPI0025B032C6|nr:ABC transporter permease [Actinomadura sp. DC4]MDN3356189.1 ABC transporter permease [Actinomadura sp. DC4]
MLRDIWLIFCHQLRLTMGGKAGLVFGAVQPVLNLALFGPLLSAYLGPDSWQVFVPGVLMQLALLSAGLAGFGIVFDARFGVLERQRVTPAGRTALLLGRVLTNVVVLLGQSALVVALGFAFGFRVPVAGLLIGVALLVPLAVSLASLSYAFALVLRRQEMFAPMASTFIVPMLLLSGALLPMSTAPGWLDAISRATPFRYVVEGLRAAFAGHYASGALAAGVVVSLAFAVAAVTAGTRTFIRRHA